MTADEQSVGIFTTDAELVVRSWDNWIARSTGVPAQRACGRKLTELYPDLESRGLVAQLQRVLAEGVIEVLAPALHHYLIPCPPVQPSKRFDKMQQRVTIMPLREEEKIIGAIVSIEDVTARLDRERDLAEQLESPDESVRLRAAEALSQDESESLQPLTGAMDDKSWRVRKMAVDGLARCGGPDAVRELLFAMRHEHRNLNILNSALQVLALSDFDVTLALAEFLEDADTDLRIYAALALGEQRDPRAIPALVRALDDAEANVRFHAIEALGNLRAVEAVDRLASVAESRDFYLAFPALDALTRIGDSRIAPRIVPLIEDELLSGPAAEALGQLGDEEVIAPLAAALERPDAPVRLIARSLLSLYDRYEKLYREGEYISDLTARAITRDGARNLLAALSFADADDLRTLAIVLSWLKGDDVERALSELLNRSSIRKEIVEALVRYGDRFIDLFIRQLDSPDPEMRQAAALALGRIGNTRAVPALIKTLSEDEERAIVIAGALARIGDRRAFEPLLELLRHPDAAVRQAAISALNSVGHPEMAGRALTLLTDPDSNVRESAVRLAGYFGYSECIDLVLERCSDEDENVRRSAVEHLAYIEDSRVIPILSAALENETPRVRAAAARAFGHIESDEALPHLLAALEDEDSWVRYYAVRSLGRHARAEGLNLLAPLAQTDAAGFVRVAAVEAIGGIGGPQAVKILVPLIEAEDPDLAHAALSALGLTRHPDALPPLLATLRSPDADRRENAIRALKEHGGTGI
ncbi:MAG TPA: HEAT repeat domain-containing protein, partial [Blastocatellia bacterium]|nr:HEAT repeat domain-containing protein [Blastocatellia bacterium]